ncbi:M20 family metallopeptidase [Atopobiaceae bacterium 24-176]
MEGQEEARLCAKLVQCESTDPGAYEGAMERLVKGWLEERVSSAGLDDVVVFRELEALPGRTCLSATIPARNGSSDSALVFCCHMDTVVAGDGWSEDIDPFGGKIEEGLVFGRGSCDMKGGLACALLAFDDALRAVSRARWEAGCHGACVCSGDNGGADDRSWLPRRPLSMLLTVDEEDFMRGIEAVLDAGWLDEGCWVVDTEPTDGRARISHKGRTWFEVDIEGATAHASTPWKGVDAVAAAAEFVCRLRSAVAALPAHPELGKSTVTFGQIEGGYRPYVVPDRAKVWIDMRLVPPADTALAEKLVAKALDGAAEAVSGSRGTYTVTGSRPPVERDPGSRLLAALEEASLAETGAEAPVDVFTGYTDTAVMAAATGNLEFLSYGPGSLEVAHKPDEHVPVADLVRVRRVLSRLAADCCL